MAPTCGGLHAPGLRSYTTCKVRCRTIIQSRMISPRYVGAAVRLKRSCTGVTTFVSQPNLVKTFCPQPTQQKRHGRFVTHLGQPHTSVHTSMQYQLSHSCGRVLVQSGACSIMRGDGSPANFPGITAYLQSQQPWGTHRLYPIGACTAFNPTTTR
jgi:hypothetical protein